MIILQIILWTCVALVFHTYVAYPLILKLYCKNKTSFKEKSYFAPNVSIIMSLFNEEDVIAAKIDSIINSDYPTDKIQLIIGSDNSSDKTDTIVNDYANKHKFIEFISFSERQGKSNVINALINKAKGEILILSDANVMFDKNTIKELVKPFADERIGLVDTRMTNTGIKKEGISIQEKSYISREVMIKNCEGLLWGTMMGPFGGCFAIRTQLYSPVPVNFLVDDFYICMKVLEKKYRAINRLEAVVYEDVSNNLSDEFRRKIRIATGNFQNLWEFKNLLWPPFTGLAFSFLSHKILRWLTPLFMIFAYISNFLLAFCYEFYFYMLLAYNFIFILLIADFLLKKFKIHNIFLRFITHFMSMNLALLIGMFKAMKGVKTNVWKPTKRNQ
ncbi:MAG: glycosyltransferase [Bacteroidales bacterium]|nr:glycosyltransferase [Bacteroidales bacterium]MDD4217354.1 glycosyltransferase [Bacteroidales bacterium]MDY0140780.1 glycosyltransferase [Bacteroidales bacterium]